MDSLKKEKQTLHDSREVLTKAGIDFLTYYFLELTFTGLREPYIKSYF